MLKFGPKSDQAWSGPQLFETLMTFLNNFFFKKVDFKISHAWTYIEVGKNSHRTIIRKQLKRQSFFLKSRCDFSFFSKAFCMGYLKIFVDIQAYKKAYLKVH